MDPGNDEWVRAEVLCITVIGSFRILPPPLPNPWKLPIYIWGYHNNTTIHASLSTAPQTRPLLRLWQQRMSVKSNYQLRKPCFIFEYSRLCVCVCVCGGGGNPGDCVNIWNTYFAYFPPVAALKTLYSKLTKNFETCLDHFESVLRWHSTICQFSPVC